LAILRLKISLIKSKWYTDYGIAGRMSNERPKPFQGQESLDPEPISTPGSDHQYNGKDKLQPSTKTAQDSAREDPPSHEGIDHFEIADVPETTQWRSVVLRAWDWKPKPARYDPGNPPEFTIWLNILFGFVRHPSHCLSQTRKYLQSQAACFTVSNLYYNQAILNQIAESFNVSFEKASSVATLMQAGYASGLLLICPLGDIFPRRPFILALVTFTATLVSRPPQLVPFSLVLNHPQPPPPPVYAPTNPPNPFNTPTTKPPTNQLTTNPRKTNSSSP
jgi:hypothetical protein